MNFKKTFYAIIFLHKIQNLLKGFDESDNSDWRFTIVACQNIDLRIFGGMEKINIFTKQRDGKADH